jgi:hypothetical protein
VGVWLDGRRLNWQSKYQKAVGANAVANSQETERRRARIAQTQLADLLADIPLSQIQFIEVYRGIGSIPGDFAVAGCGAIAIWTR